MIFSECEIQDGVSPAQVYFARMCQMYLGRDAGIRKMIVSR